jgi:hypothetical protein
LQVNEPGFHELGVFAYAASEIDCRPAEAEFFERAIVEEAWQLVAR